MQAGGKLPALDASGLTNVASAITSGTIGGSTAISTSGSIQTSGSMTAGAFYLYDHSGAGPGSIGFQSPTSDTSYVMTWPAAAPGSNGQVLTSTTGGILSWTSPAVSSLAFNTLTNAAATGSLDNTNYAQTWNWSTATTQSPLAIQANALTTGSALNVTSSSGSLNSTNGLLNVSNSGASTSGVLAKFQANSTAGSGMTLLANGNVGIGNLDAYPFVGRSRQRRGQRIYHRGKPLRRKHSGNPGH